MRYVWVPLSIYLLGSALAVAETPVKRRPIRSKPVQIAKAETPAIQTAPISVTQSNSIVPTHDFLFRLGGFAGWSGTSGKSSPILGGALDLRVAKYFGAELFAFYDLSSQGNTPADRRRDQSGGLFDFKLQYPLAAGGFVFTPKLGLGVGSWNGTYSSFRGSFWVVGTEITRGRFGLHGSLYGGLGGSVNITRDAAFPDEVYGADGFHQFRLGFSFALSESSRVGFDYLHTTFMNTSQEQMVVPISFDF